MAGIIGNNKQSHVRYTNRLITSETSLNVLSWHVSTSDINKLSDLKSNTLPESEVDIND